MTINAKRRLATFIDKGTPTAPHMVRQEILTGLALGAGFDLDNSVPGASATLIATASSTGRRTDHSDAMLWYKCDDAYADHKLVNSGTAQPFDLDRAGTAFFMSRPGILGDCFQLEGGLDEGRFGSSGVFVTPSAASCTIWAVVTGNAPPAGYQDMWEFKNLTDRKVLFGLYRDTEQWMFQVWRDGEGAPDIAEAPADVSIYWQPVLLVGVYDGSFLRLYVNGVRVDIVAAPGIVDFGGTDPYWSVGQTIDAGGGMGGVSGLYHELGVASGLWDDDYIKAKYNQMMGWT